MSWFLGVCACCVGNSCVAVSYTLQRLAHVRSHIHGPVTKMPIFWMGLVFMGLGELGNFFALGRIPASVVAPLGSLTILLSALSGRFILGEQLQRTGYIGGLVLVVGAVAVIVSTPETAPPSGLNELQARIGHPVVLLFIASLILGAVFARRSILLLPNVFVMGVIGCFCALSTKTVSYMLQTGEARWTHPLAIGAICSLVTTVVLQVTLFQRVLSRFGVSKVVPLHFVQYTILTSVGATLLYGELTSIPATNMMFFILGCSLCFVGSYLVSTSRENGEAASTEMDAVDAAETQEFIERE